MAERVYVKTHEFDRVLAFCWAEQAIYSGAYWLHNSQKNAKRAADRLAEDLDRLIRRDSDREDRTGFLEERGRALEIAGVYDQFLQNHAEALEALLQLGRDAEAERKKIDTAGGLKCVLEKHRMFMAAAREFSPIFTVENDKRFGKPCIRGMRMTIQDVLEYQSSGMTDEEILDDFPDLTQEDLDVCRTFGLYMEEQFKKM